jgi:hypothetical protein
MAHRPTEKYNSLYNIIILGLQVKGRSVVTKRDAVKALQGTKSLLVIVEFTQVGRIIIMMIQSYHISPTFTFLFGKKFPVFHFLV